MIRGILLTGQCIVRPAIQIRVFPAQKAIASKPDSTYTLVQDLRCQAKVYALSILVAGVCVVFARVVWFTHLQPDHFLLNPKPSTVPEFQRNNMLKMFI